MPAIASSGVVRVALLVCGYWTKKLLEYNGTYLDMYRRWLNASLPPNSGYRLIMDGYDVMKEEYPEEGLIDDYDVVMVTGSPSDAFSDEPWIVRLTEFVRNVGINHPETRLVGICFGHQVISRSLGGEVGRNPSDWETGPTVLQTTYMGRLLYGVEKLELQEFHQDHVPIDSLAGSLAAGEIYLLASSDVTPNQGIVKFYPMGPNSDNPDFKLVEQVHILTSQGHPEFDERTVTELHRQRDEHDAIAKHAVKNYFGARGADSEDEPISKHGTGKRWGADYDGVLVLGKTFWEIFGVDYSEDARVTVQPKRQEKRAHKVPGQPKKRSANILLRNAA
ncbi:hypothetical protein AGABI1DRAFT_115151 [Agaricus bisporus var. burnettii JB137-S8]|uniref:Glutamine amidotransferase domain-containing protein n=1 Tax=Agaricus bisporus var. burnettii (strain JB137-S8 / ATCC MYA-4627 / FGSC 10392) TaxID=597362 RepID=K5X3X2_AGABU|nr:uncharacterized protein AGABI1DRAFT_115151 [Agaricus bisporus var. burnettii JB137-S8]EKM77592.1 hypothetical protein AGABI1DRAFT_115151 [Agaricus bisporus var. burnettii JB137-S8]